MRANARAPSLMPPPDPARGRSTRFVASVEALDRGLWDQCFNNDIEGYDYHRGVERGGVGGFKFGWYAVEETGRMICAAPAFTTQYDLATTAQGAVRKVLQGVQPWVPGQLRLGLSCLGSPVTERCQLGFAPALDLVGRQEALVELFDFWADHAKGQGISLLGLKDLSTPDREALAPALNRAGFRLAASMPSASLTIDFASEDDYLARLSASTRKDMRRKLKSRAQIRVERTHEIRPVIGDITEMYRETRARSDWAFEELEDSYFQNILESAGKNSFFTLYWARERLVAANLMLCDGTRLLDKFFVMRAAEGRQHNLYFLSWFENIAYCLEHGQKIYESGQAGYETKMRLGSELQRTWLGFRHSNPVLHRLLGLASPLLAIDQPDAARATPRDGKP